jgi:iron complex transport system ATP-binding protein
MLHEGKLFADGTAEETLTAENIRTLYNVECEVTTHMGRPHVALIDSDDLDLNIEETLRSITGSAQSDNPVNETPGDTDEPQ